MIATAATTRAAALARYGTEDGAAADIAAATAIIIVTYVWAAPYTLHILYGPALRLTDGSYLPAGDLQETYGHLYRGRRGQDDTPEKAARRATAKALTGAVLPIEYERDR